ncbi:MAG: riboflavin biosynthesis protein RibF [Planctomycetota bacterium]
MIVSLDHVALPSPAENGSVVSVGVFDGVHLGHAAILRTNVARARELGARAVVVTFREHPKAVLLGRAPRTLTSLEHRLELFRRAGIDHTLALTFDEELRQVPATEFAREWLAGRLAARKLVLGFDSKFGRGREGTPEHLRELGYDVEVVSEVVVSGRPVSSTAIREAVELGDLTSAAHMLGRPVAVYGDVVAGDARGRELGFPTANLDLHHELFPPPGVYACRVRRATSNTASLPAVTNIGFRPTIEVERPTLPRIEVHVLDFSGDLYGEFLEVEFEALLRGEQRFASLEALRAQIAIDVEHARELFGRRSNPSGEDVRPQTLR